MSERNWRVLLDNYRPPQPLQFGPYRLELQGGVALISRWAGYQFTSIGLYYHPDAVPALEGASGDRLLRYYRELYNEHSGDIYLTANNVLILAYLWAPLKGRRHLQFSRGRWAWTDGGKVDTAVPADILAVLDCPAVLQARVLQELA